jgi:hypothetical protein
MIETRAVVGIVGLAGLGGLLTALALYVAGRSKASPPKRASGEAVRRPAQPVSTGAGERSVTSVAQNPASQPTRASMSSAWQLASSVRDVGVRGATAYAAPRARPVVARTPIVVRPINRPYWEIQHWQLVGDRLNGFYRTPRGSFEGYILQPKSPRPQFFIVQPPKELEQHSHRPCFHFVGGATYSIHFSTPPPNPDAGILEVEKVLGEALVGQGRRNG